MLDRALETNSTQSINFDVKKRLREIETKLKNELILLDVEVDELKKERLELLLILKNT